MIEEIVTIHNLFNIFILISFYVLYCCVYLYILIINIYSSSDITIRMLACCWCCCWWWWGENGRDFIWVIDDMLIFYFFVGLDILLYSVFCCNYWPISLTTSITTILPSEHPQTPTPPSQNTLSTLNTTPPLSLSHSN